MPSPNIAKSSLVATPKLIESAQLASGDTTVYTVPANTAAKINAAGTLCNTSSSQVTVSVSVIPSGGTVDGSHKVVSGQSLNAGETLFLRDYLGGHLLGAGDFVSINVSAASAIDAVLSAVEMA